MKKNIKTITALSLATVLAVSGVMYASFTGSETEVKADVESQEAEDTITRTIEDNIGFSTEGVDKEETVYVISDANGNVTKTIVSDWLKNKEGSDMLTDKSDLKDIENVKSDGGYTEGENHEITWEADGSDIYYQGTSDKPLPVDVKVSYYLDGKEISPKELAGKSGKVKIRFDYIPKEKRQVQLNGENEELYVPFTMVSGCLLSNDKFTNIEVSNGKVINDGDRSIVAGVGFAGLSEDLDLSSILKESKPKIPDYVEVTADVKDFSLMMTLTFGTADLLNAVDIDDTNTMEELEQKIDELISATNQLKDGAGQLENGAVVLQTGFLTYASGIHQLSDGIYSLDAGAKQLAEKSKEFVSGLNTALNGTNQILEGLSGEQGAVAGAERLAAGAEELNAGVANLQNSIGNKENRESVIGGIYSLTNGAADLNQGLSQILKGFDDVKDENGNVVQTGLENGLKAVLQALGGTDKNTVIQDAAGGNPKTLQGGVAAVDNGMGQLQDGVADMVQSIEASIADNTAKMKQIESALAYIKQIGIDPATGTAASAEAVESYKTNYAALSGANTALQTVIAQMDEANLKENLQVLKSGTESLKKGTAELAGAVSQLSGGVSQIKAGVQSAKDGSESLAAGANKLNSGMPALESGVAALKNGTAALEEGAKALSGGVQTLFAAVNTQLQPGLQQLYEGGVLLSGSLDMLYAGTQTAAAGSAQIESGTTELSEGIDKLTTGTKTLNDGIGTFKEEGVDKIADALNGDVKTVTDRIKATLQASKDYHVYSLSGDNKTASVKFIYRTEEIKK
ncbi:MAG: hypothetical protein HFI34_07405 [Lachnospiraceae bacterium]|nr:hypothetical protein [Lachnospiraceae bacterium]